MEVKKEVLRISKTLKSNKFFVTSLVITIVLTGLTFGNMPGAIRGPITGFLVGYLGEVPYGLLAYNVIVTMTLPAIAYGLLGFFVGMTMTTYDFTNGKSLVKLSILSVVGYLLTIMFGFVIGITIEVYSFDAWLLYIMLPMVTMGIPTLLFLTPVVARIWHEIVEITNKYTSTESKA